MSRMGKLPIALKGAKVDISDQEVTVTGAKGSNSFTLPGCVSIETEGDELRVKCEPATRQEKALYGMSRSLLQGMVTGVNEGFKKELELQGVGYRGQCQGKHISLSVGLAHTVEFDVPEDVVVTMPEQTRIVVEGIDKQKVGQVAATIRGFKPPDAYKGKGIRYVGEHVALKEGKTVG